MGKDLMCHERCTYCAIRPDLYRWTALFDLWFESPSQSQYSPILPLIRKMLFYPIFILLVDLLQYLVNHHTFQSFLHILWKLFFLSCQFKINFLFGFEKVPSEELEHALFTFLFLEAVFYFRSNLLSTFNFYHVLLLLLLFLPPIFS